MWWIIGAITLFAVILVFAACKVSGDASREEESRNTKIEKGVKQ